MGDGDGGKNGKLINSDIGESEEYDEGEENWRENIMILAMETHTPMDYFESVPFSEMERHIKTFNHIRKT